MNLLSYIENEDALILTQCDPQYHPMMKQLLTKFKYADLPKSKRAIFMTEVLAQCRHHNLDEKEIDHQCTAYIQTETDKLSLFQKFILHFSDFPIVLFFYAGIYEVALDHIVEPLLNQSTIDWTFSLRLDLLINTCILYGIAKVVMYFLAKSSSTTSLNYWIVILGCFLAFIGLTYLSRAYASFELFTASMPLFILFTAILAWGALILHRRIDR